MRRARPFYNTRQSVAIELWLPVDSASRLGIRQNKAWQPCEKRFVVPPSGGILTWSCILGASLFEIPPEGGTTKPFSAAWQAKGFSKFSGNPDVFVSLMSIR